MLPKELVLAALSALGFVVPGGGGITGPVVVVVVVPGGSGITGPVVVVVVVPGGSGITGPVVVGVLLGGGGILGTSLRRL